MDKSFYRAFEDRHRGSRQLIRSRLEAYAPFMQPFLTSGAEGEVRPVAVDLGCGRGEWIELLSDWGFDAHGVDLDEGMLAACREIGLRVTHGDALHYLQGLADASQSVVSAFHVVEHIPFAELEHLVSESLRVLRPGGLLVLETPNPENLRVGTDRFYLDPTHTQPIPHPLLAFLLEHHGFHRVKVLPLQEPKGIQDKADPGLEEVLEGVSPDYGTVGQKSTSRESLAPWDEAYASHYGQGLHDLAQRFDQSQSRWKSQTDRKFEGFSQQLDRLSKEVGTLSQGIEAARIARLASEKLSREKADLLLVAESELAAAKKKSRAEHPRADPASRQTAQLLVNTQRELAAAREECRRLNAYVEAVRVSTSWRLTAPVRWLGRHFQRQGGKTPASRPAAVPGLEALPETELPATPLTPTGQQVYRNLQSAIKESSRH